MDMMPWVPAYNEDGSILEVASADDQAYHNPLRNIDDAWNETHRRLSEKAQHHRTVRHRYKKAYKNNP